MQDYKIRKDALLHEKLRNNLPLTISNKEEKLLNSDIPIQKIIGFVEMQNVKIQVNRHVLIPRYETEELILKTYEFVNKNSYVLDLCSGSGFIGIAIAKNKKCNVVLSDIDYEAISQSHINKIINQVDNIEIITSDLFENLGQKKFDVIVSNPPYLQKQYTINISVLNHEPKKALFADDKGNYFYKKIINLAPFFLKPKGILIFEISPSNVFFFKALTYLNIEIHKDINGKERIVVIKF
ncbi:peptide chain release factor N(5)-glutamine methyltransferase [Mesomycoplasma neurolyticum]|uniref:peptide chain release factor N(5)-glutamine methyltransferase n=1 Tax=Mesomycoplasma neurolyticum TaxID=2120 RepID=A0A449A647_9BACT|nr:peptide chain release factor N(5)-glutamine methyltransferase [Mesomycoplasma neurolyticum]VEU59692.1 protoporphyrinogen oxidase [Mesomycoplasma neurolyticum]